METQNRLPDAMIKLYLAALSMPRHTPRAGDSSTEHEYMVPAHAVWALDMALNEMAEALGVDKMPPECCVGSRHFDSHALLEAMLTQKRILSTPPENVG